MSTILITGGAGFIGSHTADALVAQGHQVRVLDLLDPQIHGTSGRFPEHLNPQVQCLRGDVRDPRDLGKALAGVDAVYHFAALTGVGQSMYDLRGYVDTNCTGTAALLEAIIKSRLRLKRLVLASSRAVYGEGNQVCASHGVVQPPTRARSDMEAGEFSVHCPVCGAAVRAAPTPERRPLLPISLYALSKKHQEELCQYAANVFGLPVIILRYFNVYGSRQSLKNPYTGVVSIFFNRIRAGQPISIYERGLPGRDFVHVSDVVQANVKALDADVQPGTCINVGSGVSSTILDVARALSESCGKTAELVDRGEFRVGDIHTCYADVALARELLGYQPRTTLEQGMKEFTGWAQGQDSEDQYQKTVDELSQHGLFGRATASERTGR